jgi:hypothetical protein
MIRSPLEESSVSLAASLNERYRQAMLPAVQAALDAREQLGRQVSNALGSRVLSAINSAEAIAPVSALISISETVTRSALGDSMLTSNIAAMAAESIVAEMQRSLITAQSVLGQLTADKLTLMEQTAHLVVLQNEQLMSLYPDVEIARPAALATQAWEGVLKASADSGVGLYVEAIGHAGRTTGWTVSAGVLLTERSTGVELEGSVEEILGPAKASLELRTKLRAIDEQICLKLDGAWERINEGGTDAGSQAANSLMESVDWTLRTLAPEDEVLAWHDAQGRPSDEIVSGRPTRKLRFRYIVRDQPHKEPATDLYRRAVGDLVRAIQRPKHHLQATNPRALAPIALSVEGFLLFLIGD